MIVGAEGPHNFVLVHLTRAEENTGELLMVNRVGKSLHFKGDAQVISGGNPADLVPAPDEIAGVDDKSGEIGLYGQNTAGVPVIQSDGVVSIPSEEEGVVIAVSDKYVLCIGRSNAASQHPPAGKVKRGEVNRNELSSRNGVLVELGIVGDVCFQRVIENVVF